MMRIGLQAIVRGLRLWVRWLGQGLMNLGLWLWCWVQARQALGPSGARGLRFGPEQLPPVRHQLQQSSAPRCIFVLRNNDLGDVLVITPLFAALKHRYPHAQLVVGVGDWNRPTLAQNPYVDRVVAINAPWHNKGVYPQTLFHRWRYLLSSPELEILRQLQPDLGIDVFGSAWGAMLLLRAGIPWRLGVRGYAGGAIAMQACIDYDPQLQVGQSTLRFAALLGATDFPSPRPQLFLTAAECQAAQGRWGAIAPSGSLTRVVIGPGSGQDARYWPLGHYQNLVAALATWRNCVVVLVGGRGDRAACEHVAQPPIHDWCGQLTLRQTFALVSQADLVISNSSMLMHTAAAFEVENLVLLGPGFVSRRQHDRQWGYPCHYRSLGKEPGEQAEIATVQEAIAAIQNLLPQTNILET